MDTGFSYNARRSGSGRGRLVVATILIIVLLIIDAVTGGAIRSLVRQVSADISLAIRLQGSHIAELGYFSTHAALASQNAELQRRVASLEERGALSTALALQVAELARIDRLADASAGITARVVSSSIASPYGTFLIGAGSANGVIAGSLVLSPEGTVIGTVSDVGAHTSTAQYLFASGRIINAIIDGTSLSVRGTGGGNAQTLVPHGVTVSVGDAVIAPSLGERPIGVVGHVNADPSSAAMEVYIGSPANLDSLQYVYVTPAIRAPSAQSK